MKNKIICLLLVVMASFITLNCIKKDDKDDSVVFHEKETVSKNSLLSMNIEQTAKTGDYKQVTQSNWPTEGYKFNTELSRCENGSTLSWDDTNKTVIFSGNVSDKCYVYFDIIVLTVADVCSNGDTLTDCIEKYGDKGPMATNIYIHNSSLANGAGDNSYRFAGVSENVNNYVCFGSTETPCPTDNLYRIIGLIDNKVKLIKYDYANSNLLGTDGDCDGRVTPNENYYKGNLTKINTYNWNYKATNKATNTWSTSLLNKTNLNTNFINNIGNTWSSKITTTTWKVGGNTYAKILNVVPSEAYQNEIVKPDALNSTDNATEYEAKVGLMYASDYVFAASPRAWILTLTKYDKIDDDGTLISSINWMYMGLYEWTITRTADILTNAFRVNETGYVSQGNVKGEAIRPVFNIEPSVTYQSGSGTQSDPILIK